MTMNFVIRGNVQEVYSYVYTSQALTALSTLTPFNKEIKEAMAARLV